MRWFFILLSFLLPVFSSIGEEVETKVQTGGPTVQQVITYKGPKARIAVASFRCKAAKCTGEIGEGLADMIATALFQTGKFIVLERGEGLEEIKKELQLAGSEYVNRQQAPKKGLMEGADILVIGAITAFEPKASGVGGGGIVVPLKVPVLGGVKFGKKEAYIAADIRLVDVRTGRVINATKVEGKASSWNVGGLGGGIVGSVALGGGLSVYKNTPMEKAVRVMLDNAIKAISRMVPESYYRYGSENPQASSGITGGSSQIVGGSDQIVGGSESFRAGRKILFKEDFSSYSIGDIPKSLSIKKGQVEIAGFKGKKWIRALSGEVILQKNLKLPAEFAIEWDVYLTGRSGFICPYQKFILGKEGSSDVLFFNDCSGYAKWKGERITSKKLDVRSIHHFAIQQKNGKIKIFADGKRIYSEPLGGGIVGSIPNREGFTIILGSTNPSKHLEALITNIKVTKY